MRAAWLSCLVLLALGACAAPRVATQVQPCEQQGLASWYTRQPGQTRMADGDPLDPAALTAAHRTLPFGTRVRVTDLDTGRSVVVRITDRGPVARNRIIDLSPAAATALAMRRQGVAPVRLQVEPATATTTCLLAPAARS